MEQQQNITKSHETIVLAWDKDRKLVYVRTFDYGYGNTTEKDIAQQAIAHASTFPFWNVGDSESCLKDLELIKEAEE